MKRVIVSDEVHRALRIEAMHAEMTIGKYIAHLMKRVAPRPWRRARKVSKQEKRIVSK